MGFSRAELIELLDGPKQPQLPTEGFSGEIPGIDHLTAYERRDEVVSAYPLPVSVFEEPIINSTMARGITDPELTKWFDPGFLRQHAGIFALGDTTGEIKALQPRTSRRGVILQKGQPLFDKYGIAYDQVTSKGTGISNNHTVLGVNGHEFQQSLGLYEKENAIKDIEHSNNRAQIGMRVGRTIAVLPFRHDELRKWAKEIEIASGPLPYDMEKALAVIEAKGHQAALAIRVMGGKRWQDYEIIEGKESESSYNQKPFYQEELFAQTAAAARLLVAEYTYRSNTPTVASFADFYQLSTTDALIHTLQTALKSNNYRTIKKALAPFQVHVRYRNEGLLAKYFPHLNPTNTLHNRTFGGHDVDFESTPANRNRQHNPAPFYEVTLQATDYNPLNKIAMEAYHHASQPTIASVAA